MTKPRPQPRWPRDDEAPRLARKREVLVQTGESDSSWAREPHAPLPVYVGKEQPRWWTNEVDEWMRNRPRREAKASTPELPTPTVDPATPELPAAAAPRRGRGRPRKVKVAAPAMTSPLPAVEPAPGRRKRGRPRKCVAPPELSA